MEIVVKRIAKKKTYTIGHLYILSDKDVKRTWRSGVKIGDKRIFEHSFDLARTRSFSSTNNILYFAAQRKPKDFYRTAIFRLRSN